MELHVANREREMGATRLVFPIPRLVKLTSAVALALSLLAMVGLLFANQRDAVLVKDINPAGSSMPDIRFVYFTVISDTLYFVADDSVNGYELWKSDGTEAGTSLVKDMTPGDDPLVPGDLVNFNGTLFLRANDGITGEELWISDGTEAGTTLFKDINPSGEGFPFRFRVVGNLLFFSAADGTHGRELWKSDGTLTGTVMVKDVATGTNSSFPGQLKVIDGTLFFAADDGVNGAELWRSDGTESGTVMVKEINPGGHSSPRHLTNVNGTLFFTADDGSNGRELWKSDGTELGTTMVTDINADSSAGGPRYLTNVGGTLFFTANDGSFGTELWKSDGTAAGTTMVKDIRQGALGSAPRELTNVDGILYFGANDGEHGAELWKTDGTDAGTVLVEDINPGPERSIFSQFAGIDGSLFFPADDGTNGLELWKSDGNAWNTFMVADIHSSGSSAPASLRKLGAGLVFVANDGVNGNELWFIDLTNQPPSTGAGGPYNGDEGAAIALDGTVGDADGDDVELAWSVNTPLCAFSDLTAEDPLLTCDDNGVYTTTLTVTDTWTGVATDTARVTVSNVSPSIDQLVAPDGPVLVNSTVMITATYTDPGAADTHSFEIEWGDGTVVSGAASGGSISSSHSYTSTGNYTVTVTVTDDDDGFDSLSTVIEVVDNLPPTADAGGPYAGSEGAAVTLDGSVNDPDGDPLDIRWSVDSALCTVADDATLTPSLTCGDDGVFSVTLTVTDTFDVSDSDMAQVTINNIAPSLGLLDAPDRPLIPNETVSISATYSDPGAFDTHTYEIDWGDGNVANGSAAGNMIAGDHSYVAGGRYTITVTVTDDDGDADVAITNVSVRHVALLPIVLKP